MARPEDTFQNRSAEWQPGIGHNRAEVPPEELAAELAELKAAEASTEASNNLKPLLIDYLYEVRFFPGGDLNHGDLQAFDLKHAQRQLHLILGVTHLPMDTKIIEKHIVDEEFRQWNAARNRRLLKALTAHHHWLQGDSDGVRADFSNEDLTGVNLAGRNLSHVSMANAILSGANLKGAKLVGADLTGSDLSGANMTKCDLSSASMAEANLIGAELTSANLKGADMWRANLARCIISPENLHQALGCSER